MAHQIEQMAYVGETPRHRLGHHLPPKQPIEGWAQQAGMDWTIQETPVRFMTQPEGDSLQALESFAEQKVLYRSDTRAALSVVSSRYQVLQPRAVLEFYRDLTEIGGYEMETAGVLKGEYAGRIWIGLTLIDCRSGQAAVKSMDESCGPYYFDCT